VEKRVETVGQSVFYVAEEKMQHGKCVSGASNQTFLIKATIATTQEQA
jgi:hypothetical protein